MAVLSDRDIKARLQKGDLVVKPLDEPDVQIQPAWIDLRLDNEFRVFKTMGVPYIDTKTQTEHYTEKVMLEDGRPFIIHPKEFVLAKVKEYVKLPPDLLGSVDGRSSLGRIGVVVHTTSASVNPGWEGHLVLELTNLSSTAVALYPGMRVCKLTFHELTSPAERPYDKRTDTKYQKQLSVDETKIYKDTKG